MKQAPQGVVGLLQGSLDESIVRSQGSHVNNVFFMPVFRCSLTE